MANKKINQLVSKTAILSTDLFGIGDATTGQLFKKTIAELQAAIGGAVISVNGLVGTVVLDTDDIQELATPTNKYFTDARARGAISLTVTGNSGASTYSSGTGVLNVPTYTLAGLGGITATFLSGTSGISYNSTTGVISYSGTVYTDASIRALFSGGTGITYNSSTGAISYSGTVYTDSSVRALISMTTTGDSGASTYNNTTGVINVPNYTLAGLGGISLTSLSGGTGITYNNTTGAISYSGTVYTDASVRALISLTTTGTSGASTYNSTTGVLNIPQYQAVLTNPVTGTGTTNYHAKWTSSSAIGDSLIYDNGTNISIGNVSPSEKFEIQNGYLSTYHNVNSDGAGYGIQFYSNGGGSKNSLASITLNQVGSARTGELIFKTSNAGAPSTRLTIASTGAATFSSSVTANSGVLSQVIGSDGTYGATYPMYAFTGTTNGSHRIFAGTSDDMYFAAATSRGFEFRANGGTSSNLKISSTGAATFSSSVTANEGLIVSKTSGASVQVASFFTGAMTEGQHMYLSYGKSASSAEGFYQVYNHSTTSSSRYIAWQNNAVGPGSQSLVLTAAGNVGIGTTSPSAALDIDVASGLMMRVKRTGVAGEFQIYQAANIVYLDSSASSGNLAFATVGTERGRITPGGNWLLGTTSDNGEKLYVSGAIRATGTITANSDITLKKNLLKIQNALEKVEQINGYTYEFKEDDSKRHAGVIAQEIQTVLPEIVNKGNDGILGVEYGNISALLIEAIKEQQTQINELKALLNK